MALWLSVWPFGSTALHNLGNAWEFTAAEVAKFRADPLVKNVFLMIDWRARRIDLKLSDTKGPTLVTYGLVTTALAIHDETKTFTPAEAAIRDHFDAFLDYLCHFAAVMTAGLIRQEELRPYLEYWAGALAGHDNIPRTLLVQFWTFVDCYGYLAARNLVSRLHPSLAKDFPASTTKTPSEYMAK